MCLGLGMWNAYSSLRMGAVTPLCFIEYRRGVLKVECSAQGPQNSNRNWCSACFQPPSHTMRTSGVSIGSIGLPPPKKNLDTPHISPPCQLRGYLPKQAEHSGQWPPSACFPTEEEGVTVFGGKVQGWVHPWQASLVVPQTPKCSKLMCMKHATQVRFCCFTKVYAHCQSVHTNVPFFHRLLVQQHHHAGQQRRVQKWPKCCGDNMDEQRDIYEIFPDLDLLGLVPQQCSRYLRQVLLEDRSTWS